MATSSIRKNFVVYGDEQAKIFANAIEESANHAAPEIKVDVKKNKRLKRTQSTYD